MSPILSLSNISKSFKTDKINTLAVNMASLNVYKQDFISIKGASGSGKSTLLSILGLLEPFNSGQYQIAGTCTEKLTTLQKGEIRNHHFGYIFQSFNLVEELNAWQNVALPLSFRKSENKKQSKESALRMLAKVGLEHRTEHYPSQLSGGQQQRVAIARALVTKPDIILADEPTGNLDSHTSNEIEQLLIELNQQGQSLIVVTHDHAFADKARRKFTMNDGSLVEHN